MGRQRLILAPAEPAARITAILIYAQAPAVLAGPGEFTRRAYLNGKLDLTLNLSYLKTTLYGKAVTLRSMFGSIPAPTLRVNAGDTLRILVVNQLPPNPPSTQAAQHLRYPNSTNLHVHGVHVNPGR